MVSFAFGKQRNLILFYYFKKLGVLIVKVRQVIRGNISP